MNSDYSLQSDLKFSIISAIVLVSAMYFLKIPYILNAGDLNLFISLLTTILGVLLTILAILYTFETSLKENEAVKILISRGKYHEIYDRFTDSTAGIFYSLIALIFLYFFIRASEAPMALYVFALIAAVSLILTFLRTYRCFFVFGLLQNAMRECAKRKQ